MAASSMRPPSPEEFRPSNELFVFDRKIDHLYSGLSWPKNVRQILVYTLAIGGLGDFSTAAKVIGVLQRISPDLSIHWTVEGCKKADLKKIATFLENGEKVDLSKGCPPEGLKPDLILSGPIPEKPRFPDIEAETFLFSEFGFNDQPISEETLPLFEEQDRAKIRDDLFSAVFKQYIYRQGNGFSTLPMGLREGTGVLFNQEKLDTPLSLGHCCPSYLEEITHPVKEKILEVMGGSFDYNAYSLNLGYTAGLSKKYLFVEFVALQEKDKNVIVVLNNTLHGQEMDIERYFSIPLLARKDGFGLDLSPAAQIHLQALSSPELAQALSNPMMAKMLGITESFDLDAEFPGLKFFRDLGYKSIQLIDVDGKELAYSLAKEGRTLTVLFYNRIPPQDMRRLQFASERLLGTGDNSSVENFEARAKMIVYETYLSKGSYLKQQVEVAQTISPDLATLLEIFTKGGHGKFGSLAHYTQEEQAEIHQILSKDSLRDETLLFCREALEKHSFEPVLRDALLRAAYHAASPVFAKIEESVLGADEELKTAIAESDRLEFQKPLPDASLLSLGEKITAEAAQL